MNNSERENGNCAHEDVLAATFGLVSDIQLAGRETVVDLSVAFQSCLVDRYIAECEKALNVVTTCTPEDGKKKKKLDAGKRTRASGAWQDPFYRWSPILLDLFPFLLFLLSETFRFSLPIAVRLSGDKNLGVDSGTARPYSSNCCGVL